MTISGYCLPILVACHRDPSSPYTLDEHKAVLNVTKYRNQNEPVNDSLKRFYGREQFSNKNPCIRDNTGSFLYSLPWQSGNTIVQSVSENGTVALRYDDIPIVLKPEEFWEIFTRKNKWSMASNRNQQNTCKTRPMKNKYWEDDFHWRRTADGMY